MIGVAQLVGLIWLFVRRETLVAAVVAGAVALVVGVLLFFVRKAPGVAAAVGGGLAILTGSSLLLMALPVHPVVVVILAPPILGGIVAMLYPERMWVLGGAMLLVLVGAYLILIAGAGLLYVPAVVALAYAMWAARLAPAH